MWCKTEVSASLVFKSRLNFSLRDRRAEGKNQMSFQAAGGRFPAPAPGGGMFPSPAAVPTSGVYQTGTVPPGGGMYPSGPTPPGGMFPHPGMMAPNPHFPAMRPTMVQPGILPMPPMPPGGKLLYVISHQLPHTISCLTQSWCRCSQP